MDNQKKIDRLIQAVSQENIPAVRQLIEAGTDVNGVDGDGLTPLHYAAIYNGKPNIAEELIRAGARVDALDGENATPLHRAAFRDKVAVAKCLLSNGADPTLVDIFNRRPEACVRDMNGATRSWVTDLVKETKTVTSERHKS